MEYTAGCCCSGPLDCPQWNACLPARIRIRIKIRGASELQVGTVIFARNEWSYDWDTIWKRQTFATGNLMYREQASLTWSFSGKRWNLEDSIYANSCFMPCPATGPFGYLEREENGSGVFVFAPNVQPGGLASPYIDCTACPGSGNPPTPIQPLTYVQTGETDNLSYTFKRYNALGQTVQQGVQFFKASARVWNAEPGCLRGSPSWQHYWDASIRKGPGLLTTPNGFYCSGQAPNLPSGPCSFSGLPSRNERIRYAICGEVCGAVWCINQTTGKLTYGCGCGGPLPNQPSSLWFDRAGLVPFVSTYSESSDVTSTIV